MPAAALRRPDPGARPADRLRRQDPRPRYHAAAGTRWSSAALRAGSAIAAAVRHVPLDGGAMAARYGADPARGRGVGRGRASGAGHLPAWARAPRAGRTAAAALRLALAPRRRRPRPGALAAGAQPAAWAATAAARSIHRLLQLLPDLAAAGAAGGGRAAAGPRARPHRRRSARRWRRRRWRCWTTTASPPCSGPARAPRSRSPAPPRGLPPGLAISGRVDRLLVEDRTGCWSPTSRPTGPAPAAIEDADPAYVRQMAVYAAVLARDLPRPARWRRRWSGPMVRSSCRSQKISWPAPWTSWRDRLMCDQRRAYMGQSEAAAAFVRRPWELFQ